MARTKGAKNKRTVLREARMAVAAAGADIADLEDPIIDGLTIMESGMRYFHNLYVKERRKSVLSEDPEEREDAKKLARVAAKDATDIAKEVLQYHRPKLAALKVSGDPENPVFNDREALRALLLQQMRDLGLFEDLEQLSPPQGVANREPEEG